jgi:hypothetical protein
MLIATSSTMFANPQVTSVRMFTYPEAGIRLQDGVIFIVMQIIVASLAVLTWREHSYLCNDFNCKVGYNERFKVGSSSAFCWMFSENVIN